jgi:hypothetical protein
VLGALCWSYAHTEPTTTTANEVGNNPQHDGQFYSQDTWEGRPIFVGFIWNSVDAKHTSLEQAYSNDGGKTWETNWIYEGERVSN